jgi:hypothetical protein
VTVRRWLLLVSTLVVPACSSTDACDLCTTSAVVYGTVRRSGGAVVAGASIHLGAFRESCDSGDLEVPGDPGLTTGTDGSYRAQLVALSGQFTACVRVMALEPGSASGDPGVTADGMVEFLPDFGSGEPRDSVGVDLELP